jgi:hypothetical protein
VHTYETDDETVLEVQLSKQPVLTLSLEDRTLTLRIPRSDPGPERWHMNADVTGV